MGDASPDRDSQNRPCGRSYGGMRARLTGAGPRLFWSLFVPGLPVLILAHDCFRVEEEPNHAAVR